MGAVVLCIGDGGNDCSMIQAADAGVGIVGKEGLQAARAADYSISRFRMLPRLLQAALAQTRRDVQLAQVTRACTARSNHSQWLSCELTRTAVGSAPPELSIVPIPALDHRPTLSRPSTPNSNTSAAAGCRSRRRR